MDPNEFDDLGEAIRNHTRPPRDIVPRTTPIDNTEIPTGTQQLTWHEMTPNGITTHVETIEITRPIGAPDEQQ